MPLPTELASRLAFRYNGTGNDFKKLEVLEIAPKTYMDEISKPLWAVENSGDRKMDFNLLWGLVSDEHETTRGFDTVRAESLWLPTSPSMTDLIQQTDSYDALAATGGLLYRLANLYSPRLFGVDYTGEFEYALHERWTGLSQGPTTASQIPSLILTNGLAAGLVGTKTSFSPSFAEWPASLASDNTVRGFPRAKVQVYRRIIQYDIRYAIPAFVILALLLIALAGAIWSAITTSHIVRTMQRMYNQTSAGRLAINLLYPKQSDPTQPSSVWTREQGCLVLAFGNIKEPEDDRFCRVVKDEGIDSKPPIETIKEPRRAGDQSVLPVSGFGQPHLPRRRNTQ